MRCPADVEEARSLLEQRLPCIRVRRLEVRPGERAAAVLLPILDAGGGEDGPALLLERRAGNLGNHAGQYAFPGGVADPGDASPVATALREAHEETGLEAERVRVVGRLSDIRTPTGFVITPVVGVVEGRPRLSPHEEEVEELVLLPLCELLKDDAFVMVRRRARGVLMHGHALVYRGRIIWGATARMLMALRRVLRGPEGGCPRVG